VGQTDDVLILAAGFDFGGAAFTGDAPSRGGTLEWDQGWFGVVPRISGFIHFKRVASSCAHLTVRSFDEHNVEIGTAVSSPEVCAFSDAYSSEPVEVQAAVGAAKVEVILETRAGNLWGSVGDPVSVQYGTGLVTDDVLIARAETDLGGEGRFLHGTPAEPGRAQWFVLEGDKIWSYFTGTLFVHEADELCVRVKAEYRNTSLDNVVQTDESEIYCHVDDDLHTYPIILSGYDVAIDEVRFVIQVRTSGAVAWEQRGAQTISLGAN
jgi:hypothetical protein